MYVTLDKAGAEHIELGSASVTDRSKDPAPEPQMAVLTQEKPGGRAACFSRSHEQALGIWKSQSTVDRGQDRSTPKSAAEPSILRIGGPHMDRLFPAWPAWRWPARAL